MCQKSCCSQCSRRLLPTPKFSFKEYIESWECKSGPINTQTTMYRSKDPSSLVMEMYPFAHTWARPGSVIRALLNFPLPKTWILHFGTLDTSDTFLGTLDTLFGPSVTFLGTLDTFSDTLGTLDTFLESKIMPFMIQPTRPDGHVWSKYNSVMHVWYHPSSLCGLSMV